MTAPSSGAPSATLPDRHALITTLATAALLAVPPFVIGVQAAGIRAGVAQAVVILIATAVFGRLAFQRKLPRPFNASLGVMLLALLAGLTAISVGWSLLPNASYLDAVRLITYVAALALAALAAQLIPQRSREVLLGIGLAALIVTLYAVFSHVVPSWFSNDDFARLRLPFGYWNAVGTVAAIGFLVALWAGTHRAAPRWLEIVSYPAGGAFLVGIMLAQSRGALFAAAIAIGIWLVLTPLRLRTSGWLAAVGFFSAIVVLWAYNKTALSTDGVALADRKSAGLQLGAFLVVLFGILTAAGFVVNRQRVKRPLAEAQRRSIGKVLLILLAISPFVLIIGASVAGDDGASTVPNAVHDAFTSSSVPANTPGRLTETGSLRGRYWDDARHIFSSHTFHGAGADTFSAARLPYRTDQITARHAHGVIPQVAADLGVLGLIVLFGLALVWFSAAFKLVGARRAAPTRWLDGTGEDRLAAVTIMLGAVVFGIENSIDWSWYVPGVAYFGLIAAGWTLGHPEAHSPAVAGEPVSVDSRKFAIARAVLIAVVGLWIAWAVYQPVRAERKIRDGVAIAESNPVKALKLGQEAREIDPTSDEAAFLIATAQSNGGRQNEADATLLAVANEQPANPETWRRLAEFRLNTLHKPLAAIEALRPLLYTSPADINGTAMLIQARDARVKQLVKVAAEKERKRLEAQFDKLEKQLEALKNQPRPAVTPGTTQ